MPLMSDKYAMEHLTVAYEWSRHRNFMNTLEPQLEVAFTDWQQFVSERLRETEDEIEKDFFIDYYNDGVEDFQHHQVILVNSFFTGSWSLFEHQLTKLCDLVKCRSGNPFSVRAFRGSFTDVAKDYLKKLGVDFPAGTAPEWPRIKKYQEVRNKIIHQGAAVPRKWGYYKWAEGKGIVNDSRKVPRFELTRSFCTEAADDFEEFLSQVITEIARWDGSNSQNTVAVSRRKSDDATLRSNST